MTNVRVRPLDVGEKGVSMRMVPGRYMKGEGLSLDLIENFDPCMLHVLTETLGTVGTRWLCPSGIRRCNKLEATTLRMTESSALRFMMSRFPLFPFTRYESKVKNPNCDVL